MKGCGGEEEEETAEEERMRGAHSPVVLVPDVPAAGVALVSVHGVLPIRPLRRQHEGSVLRRGVAGGRHLGDEPPPCAKAVFFKLFSTYKLSSSSSRKDEDEEEEEETKKA